MGVPDQVAEKYVRRDERRRKSWLRQESGRLSPRAISARTPTPSTSQDTLSVNGLPVQPESRYAQIRAPITGSIT